MTRAVRILLALALLGALALAGALLAGSAGLGWHAVAGALVGHGTPLARAVVLGLRLPRAVAAFATGGLLAVAGALMQVLLRNPLADPYVLGISGGAAVGALSAMMLGWAGTVVSGGAFAGAMLSMLLVFGVARLRGQWSATRLLLTGVVVAAGWGAVISLLLALSPGSDLSGMLFWMMGDLGRARGGVPALLVLLLTLAVCVPLGRHLNLLARGRQQAAALGVNAGPLELGIYVLASLLTATAVTVAGTVGFVGLVVPHMLRLATGNDQRLLLPASALAGGALLTAADTLARTVIAPEQLPVGVITALIGVPTFLYLLNRGS
ncbi:MAG TPA: iron ABC transporter permease [Gammaproteobacteria bacterium]|nr:iron ABC transporter permease [Gammaproteobacteria bacterium]